MKKKFSKLIGLSKEDFDNFITNNQIQLREARLIPLYKIGDEMALTSVFLSTLRLVKEFRETIYKEIKISRAGKSYFFTEVAFPEIDKKSRIDGLIITISAGKIKDAAFFEMKNKNGTIEPAQIERYQSLARSIGVNKLITVSNQFVPDSSISPVEYKKLKNINSYHFSWTYVLTIAHLLLIPNDDNIQDDDQIEIMKEVVNLFECKESGVTGFNQMNKTWKDVVEKTVSNATLKESDQDVNDAVLNWLQEEKDMALMLSRELGVLVTTASSKKKDNTSLLKTSIKNLTKNQILTSILHVKGSASDIFIEAGFARKTISMSVTLNAPLDKGFKGRCGWIIRQFESCSKKKEELFKEIKDDLWVEVGFKYTNKSEMFKYTAIEDLYDMDKSREITTFKIILSRDIGRNFSSSKKFVEIIEEMLLTYYEAIVQNLTNWERPAPKVIED